MKTEKRLSGSLPCLPSESKFTCVCGCAYMRVVSVWMCVDVFM